MNKQIALLDSQSVETRKAKNDHLSVIKQSNNSEAAMLSMSGGKLEGLLHARTIDRRTPERPASQLHASFIVHGDYQVRHAVQFKQHAHPSFELNIITEGSWRCTMRGVDCELQAGDAILAQPGDRHSDQITAGTRYRGLRFALHQGWQNHQPLLRDGLAPTLQKIPQAAKKLIPHLDRIQASYDDDNPMCGLIQDAILLQMVWELAALLPEAALHPQLRNMSQEHRHRRGLINCFDTYASNPIGIAEMADELDISVRSLQNRCQDYFGLSPSRAFLQYRLERARQLLHSGAYSVGEVSDAMGFSNAFHFSRCYKEQFGMPPSQDRG